MTRYFDLHAHPSLKPFLSAPFPENKDSCWKTYKNAIEFLRSQGSLEQMVDGNVRLAVNALYSMEKVFSAAFVTRYLAPKFTPLDKQMMASLASADYFDRLIEEYEHLLASRVDREGDGRDFQILNNMEDFNPEKLNIILAIEGGHGLEKSNRTFARSLLDLKQGEHRLLYITLTHLTRCRLANHAYGMKLIKNVMSIRPEGLGLSDIGKELIDAAYRSQGKEKPIYIDIKHLSLAARRDFYHYRERNGYSNIPILATHMGVTGISYDPDIVREYIVDKKFKENRGTVEVLFERPQGIGRSVWKGGGGETHFNPWSINLYDEEIPVILESGGLIGLILDQRVLGANPVKGEYFSKVEFDAWMAGRLDQLFEEFEEDEPVEEVAEPLVAARALGMKQKDHLRHLCNNILHIAKIGGPDAWNQLCLGTDFDGMIDPINGCRDSTELGNLEEDLVDMLGRMIQEAKEADPTAEFYENDLRRQVRNIMYYNGVRFLEANFV